MADIKSNIQVNIDTANALSAIKNLQAQISAFHSSIRNSGNAANKAVSDNLTQNLLNSVNATKQFSASLTTISDRATSFTNALEKNKFSLGQYFKYGAATSKTFSKAFAKEFDTIELVARERVKTMQTQFIKLGRTANGAIEAIKVRPLTLDMDNLGTQVAMTAQKQQIFNQLLKQGSTNLLNFGKNTQWAGRQLMVGFTLPLAVLGSSALKTFQEMEEQAIRFKRVYGELFTTQAETDAMVKELQKLASEFTKYGVSVADTMGLAADAAAMGKMGADLTAQVAEATRLAVLGGVEQADALETTISITNAFGVASEDLAEKIDFLNAVENQTVTAIEDLTIAIPKAGPVIKQLGGDVEDLAFFLTAMKEGGINASEGANALKSGLAKMINPTAKATEMLAGLGININGIVEGNAGDIKSTVIQFAQALDTLDPLSRARAIEELFGKFQFARISTLFQNVVAEGNQAQRVLQLTQATSQELAILSERELQRVEDSPLYKFQKSIEDLQKSLAPIGEQFAKLVTPLVNFATDLLDRFNNLSDGVKSFITGTIATLGLLAPVALMIFGLLANGVANIIKGFGVVRSLFIGVSQAGTGLSSSMGYMTQEHLEAATSANSLGAVHSNLINIFTSEQGAISNLRTAYEQATIAINRFNVASGTRVTKGPKGNGGLKLASGIVSVPGPKGAGDIVPAMLSPGEAVIPADKVQKYGSLISGMIADNIPGFRRSNVKVSGSEVTLAGQTFVAQGNAAQAPAAAERLGDELDKLIAGFQVLGLELDEAEEAAAALAAATAERSKNDKVSARELRKTEEDQFGGGVALAGNRTVESRELRGRADNDLVKGNEGITLSHAGSPVPLNSQQREKLASQMTPGPTRDRVLDSSKALNAYSEEVFPTPAILNAKGGILSKGEAADIIRQNPAGLAADAAESAGLDPNSPAFQQFGQNVADELAADASAAFSDMDLTPAVNKAIDKMEDSAEKRVLQDRKKTFRTIGGGKGEKRFSLRKGIEVDLGDGRRIEGGTSYTDRRDKKKPEARLAAHKEADKAVVALAAKKVKQAEKQAKAEGTAAGKAFANARNKILKKTGDAYPATRKRNSPHRLAAKDGADDGKAYGKARNKALTAEEKKIARQAAAQKRSSRAGKAFGVLGTATMVAGMATQVGGPVGEIAGKAMQILPALSAIVPALMSLPLPIAIAVGAIGLLGFTLFKLNESQKKASEQGRKLADSLAAGAGAMDDFSKYAGTVNPTEVMSRTRTSQFGDINVKTGKTEFGDNYLASDPGKELVASVEEGMLKLGKSPTVSRVVTQLGQAVASNILTKDQASNIVYALGNQLGDSTFALSVNGQLNELLGPDGENVLTDGLTLQVRLNERSLNSIIGPSGSLTQMFSEAGGAERNWLTGFITDVDWGKLGNLEGQVAGEINGVVQQIALGLDTLDARYLKQIQALKDSGDLTGALSKQKEYEQERAKLIASNEQMNNKLFGQISEIEKRYEEAQRSGFAVDAGLLTQYRSIEAVVNQSEELAKAFFDGNEEAKKLVETLSNSDELGSETKLVFNAALTSDTLSIDAAKSILEGDLKSSEIELVADMMIKYGAGTGQQMANILSMFAGDANAAQKKTDFLLMMDSQSTEEFNRVLNLLDMVTAYEGAIGKDGKLIFDAYMKDPKKLDALLGKLTELNELADGKKLEYDVIINTDILGADGLDALKQDAEYFKALDPVQKFLYVQTMLTVEGTYSTADVDSFLASQGVKPEGRESIGIEIAGQQVQRGRFTAAQRNQGIIDMMARDAQKITEAATAGTGTGEETEPAETDTGSKSDPFANILSRLKQVRNAAINAAGGVAELMRVLGKGKELTLFKGISQQLTFAGYGKEFSSYIAGLDEETRSKFVSIENGIVKVTAAGKAMSRAFSEAALGDYQLSLVQGVSDINKQIQAVTTLTSRGLSLNDSYEIARDANLAYAIATAATTEEVDELIFRFQKLQEAQEKWANTTPEGIEQGLSKAFGSIKEFFAAQEEAVNLAFQSDTSYLTNGTDGLITKAAQEIEDYQYLIDDLNYELDGVAKQEDAINKKYDERIEALNKVYEINEDLASQEKGKLGIASALASGDIAAAARAIQEQRKQQAEQQRKKSEAILESSRQKELSSVTSSNNRTRLDIENQIKDITEKIATIEEERLEPNQKLLKDAERLRDVNLEAIGNDGYLGKTKAEWALVENGIRLAKVESEGYGKSIEDAMLNIEKLKALYADPATFTTTLPEDFAPVSQNPTATDSGSSGGTSGSSGPTKDPDPTPSTSKDPGPMPPYSPGAGKYWKIVGNKWVAKAIPPRPSYTPQGTYWHFDTSKGQWTSKKKSNTIPSGGGSGGGTVMYRSSGGMVPKYLAAGGFARGTDTIPAMLTPGEFVVRKYAVDKFGADNLKAINSGANPGGTMYNSYEVNVNVKSDSNPDQIARAVMNQIKQVDSQRLRGNRF